jgi:hypothetical protein
MKRLKLFESFLDSETIQTSNKNIPFSLKENAAEPKISDAIDGVKIQKVNFSAFKESAHSKEGIVLTGTGGDIDEWINGVTTTLNEEGIAKGTVKDLWSEIYVMKTSGGRSDTALVFKEGNNIDLGKLAMWRLRFGDCSWISDYLVNYAKQH